MTNYSDVTVQGWRLLGDERYEEAQQCFRAAVDADPCDIGAWLGLSRAVDTRDERLACLHVVLDLHHDSRSASTSVHRFKQITEECMGESTLAYLGKEGEEQCRPHGIVSSTQERV